MIKLITRVALWILRKMRKDQKEQEKQQEELLQLKKKREDDAYYDEKWKEKLDRAWRECSSYGKSHTQSRTHYRRKSAH